jgi:hypothetical protein
MKKFFTMWILSLSILALVAGCGKNDIPDLPPPPPAATPTPMPIESDAASSRVGAPVAMDTPVPTATPFSFGAKVDACSLVTKQEVEAAIGHKVLAPEKDDAANSCYFGDPEGGMEDGRAISQLVTITVFAASGGEIRDGVAAPARDAFEAAKKNATSVQALNDLKDEAYWDEVMGSIHVVKGNYSIEINIASENPTLAAARKLAEKVLAKLP